MWTVGVRQGQKEMHLSLFPLGTVADIDGEIVGRCWG